jgi:hypothetical protein
MIPSLMQQWLLSDSFSSSVLFLIYGAKITKKHDVNHIFDQKSFVFCLSLITSFIS